MHYAWRTLHYASRTANANKRTHDFFFSMRSLCASVDISVQQENGKNLDFMRSRSLQLCSFILSSIKYDSNA